MEKKRSDVDLLVLLKYYALFIFPVLVSLFISWQMAKYVAPKLDISVNVTMQVLMIVFTFIIFSILVPYIRKRENVTGVRYALVGFFLFGMFMTLPSLIKGYSGMLLMQFLYIANYILLTFIYCPEVLGINTSLKIWFSKSRQLLVILIYLSIVLFYSMGFAWLYFEMAIDPVHPNAFNMEVGEYIDYGTFLYFSIITFTTIGYGEITPNSPGARMVVGFEAILGMVINAVFIAILFMYISNIQAVLKEEEKIIKEEKRIEEKEKNIEKREDQIEEKEEKIIKLQSKIPQHPSPPDIEKKIN